MEQEFNIKLLKELLFIDPETGDDLYIISPPQIHSDGSYSFFVGTPDGKKWKHTIKTEEVPDNEN